MTPEEASALATRAFCADVESWAAAVAEEGYVGLNDLLQVLDRFRDTTKGVQ